MGNVEKRKYMLIASCLCICFAPGCTVTKQPGDPDKVLQNAVSGISEKGNFAFKGKTEVRIAGHTLPKPLFVEGFVVGHDQMVLKTHHDARPVGSKSRTVNELSDQSETIYFKRNKQWVQAGSVNQIQGHILQDGNPVMKLEQVMKMKRRASINSEKSNGDVVVLNIDLDPEKMKSALQTDLKRQQKAIDLQQFIRNTKAITTLSPAQEQRMRAELTAQMGNANRELNNMLKTLQLRAASELWVDRETRLPKKLKTVTMMAYRFHGADRKETTSTSYVFNDYDKPFKVPRRSMR